MIQAFEEFDAVINSPRFSVPRQQQSLPESTVTQEEVVKKPKHNSALLNNLKKVNFEEPPEKETSKFKEITNLAPTRILKHKSSKTAL